MSNTAIAHIHLDWIFPLPANFEAMVKDYKKIIIPELNNGQLANYLRAYTQIPIFKINKIQGVPFYSEELIEEFKRIL
jgi:2-oxoglutarate/2-oxoacid ferredoxin oxidoreductase subunit alpha